jgi:hypothetical protein
MSWKTGCYIHAGLSSTGPVSIKGPDAKKYLQGLLINSLTSFPIGSMKRIKTKRIKSFCAAKPAQKLGWPTRAGRVLAGTAYGSFTPSGLMTARGGVVLRCTQSVLA